MLYDFSNDKDYQKAQERLAKFREKGIYVDITGKEEQTLSQNAYIHVCIGFFAMNYKCTLKYAKEKYFKEQVNKDLFVYTYKDRFGNEIQDLRSSSELTKEEMSLAIDRWCQWCIESADIPMPDPEDYKVCMWIKKTLERKKIK